MVWLKDVSIKSFNSLLYSGLIVVRLIVFLDINKYSCDAKSIIAVSSILQEKCHRQIKCKLTKDK